MFLFHFSRELDGRSLVVEVLVEVLQCFFSFIPDDEGVIHIPSQVCGLTDAVDRASSSKCSM